jgi:ketopantoate reductase
VGGERRNASPAHNRGMSKQILIVGCGAIGGLFAAALSSAARVTVLDTNAEHVDAINASGLRIIGRSPRIANIRATAEPAALKDTAFEAVIFLIKSKMTVAALAQLRPMLAGNPVLVTLQNGMGNAEALLSGSKARVIRGATMNAGRYVEPGWSKGKAGSVRRAAASRTCVRSPIFLTRLAWRPKSLPIRWAPFGRNSSSIA